MSDWMKNIFWPKDDLIKKTQEEFENKKRQNDVYIRTCMLKAQNPYEMSECEIEYYKLDYELKKWKIEMDEKNGLIEKRPT
jgi:hypothetical protein